jgi:hypothetical protein
MNADMAGEVEGVEMEGSPGTLSLTWEEVMLLTDRVANNDMVEGAHGPKDLILKLGSAYLESIHESGGKPGEVTLVVSEAEAWLLRGKVNSFDKMANRPQLGIGLLRKIYRVLLAYNATVDLPVVAGRDELDRHTVREAMARWRQSQNGNAGTDNSSDNTNR